MGLRQAQPERDVDAGDYSKTYNWRFLARGGFFAK
jgi:hypothetical protein